MPVYGHCGWDFLRISGFSGQQYKKIGQKLLRRIWTDGNFGLYNKERTRPKGYWAGKWHTFTSSVSRCAELFSMAPAEACCYPIRIAVNSAWEQIKMRL